MTNAHDLAPAGNAGGEGALRLPRAALAAYAPLALLVLLYAATGYAAMSALPSPPSLGAGGLIAGHIFLTALIFVIWRMVEYARSGMPESPARQLLKDARAALGNPARMLNAAVLMPLILVFIKVFSELKMAIPQFHPFCWDEAFMRLDRALHGGCDPWRLLQPVLGHPLVTFLVNLAYNVWFLALLASLTWVTFSRGWNTLKIRYLTAFLLLWSLGGSLAATVFSSAGPAFYAGLNLRPDPFAPLMAYLHEADGVFPVWALGVQETLWRAYAAGEQVLGGLSAFPSMHNGTAALMMFAAWKSGRRAGVVMSLYAALIFIGSVHLGWHYAVDGYAAFALAAVCWAIAGPLSAWMSARPAARRLRALERLLDAESRSAPLSR